MIHPISRSSDLKVPLKSLSVHAFLQNSLANLTISQAFTNTSSSPLECEYHLPTLPQGVVTDLKIRLPDGSVLSSEITEKEKAQERYQDTISQGHSAAMGIQKDDSTFIITLGNLLPNDSVEILINYVYPLQSEKDFWRFQFVSGFIPLGMTNYNLEFTIEVKSDSEILEYSSTWKWAVDKSDDGKNLLARVDKTQFNPDTILEFKYSTASIIIPKCLIQHNGSKYAAMLSFIPYCDKSTDITETDSTAEFIFVLDRSGSMEGSRIDLAKNAALLFLKSIPSISKFNIVSFGSDFSLMFPQSVLANSQNISEAISALSTFTADMVGTEILQPLQNIFSTPVDKAYPRFLFLLTDGDVSSVESVISLIKMNSCMNRVNCFGIEDANRRLIEGSAEAGKGLAYFIHNAKEISGNVISALEQCMVPCISDWEVTWAGDLVPKPKDFGVLKYGEKFEIFALIENISENLPVLKIFDTSKGGYKEFRIERFEEVAGDSIFKLWAKNKINELETEGNKDMIVQISKEFKVPSKETALICVKTNSDGSQGDLVSVKIEKKTMKIAQPDIDYGYTFQSMNCCYSIQSAAACLISAPLYDDDEELEEEYENLDRECEMAIEECCNELCMDEPLYAISNIPCMEKKTSMPMEAVFNKKVCEEENIPISLPAETVKVGNFLDIISLIDSEGFWEIDSLLAILKLPSNKINEILAASLDSWIIATILALSYLKKYFDNEKNEWVLIERKAIKWLKKSGIDIDTLVNQIISII